MKEIFDFLRECGTFYIATDDHGQPRVRPFGAVFIKDDRLYIVTNNTKKCYHQMKENSRIEISGMNKKGQWIRLEGDIEEDDRQETKEFALNELPMLKNMYKADDGIFATLYFTKGKADILSFKGTVGSYSF
jgi:uncharacterized pyridoxamine 5'-phosphate oxidase family protein